MNSAPDSDSETNDSISQAIEDTQESNTSVPSETTVRPDDQTFSEDGSEIWIGPLPGHAVLTPAYMEDKSEAGPDTDESSKKLEERVEECRKLRLNSEKR